MLDRMGRDEMFHKIAHIDDLLWGSKEEVLEDMRNIDNPNFQDYQGVSYLDMACQAHSLEAIRLLLDLGANPNINDKRGLSPITYALGRINPNNKAILEIMLQYGLDLKKMEREQTLKEWIEMFEEEELNSVIKEWENEHN